MRRARLIVGALVLVLVALPAVPAVAGAPAGPTALSPIIIGVDHTPPPGKNWEYTHYFPESNVNVPRGGVVVFQWAQGQPNGFHSVTFLPLGQSEAQARSTNPLYAKDTDNGETDVILTPQANNPTTPGCGTGATAPPCSFDGTAAVSSGILPTGSGATFSVQMAATLAPGTYKYICLVHPAMSGTVNIIGQGQAPTDPATLASSAAAELKQLNTGALSAEANDQQPQSVLNADGTRTWTEKVGVTADDVELLEYLPDHLAIGRGDSVTFDSSQTSRELHAVTTPAGANQGLLPFLPAQCEVPNGPDKPAPPDVNGPPQSGCSDPAEYEQPRVLGVQGEPSTLSSQETAASVAISGRPDLASVGVASAHTYRFSHNGTYVLFCAFHSNMGAVVATPGYRLAGADGGTFTEGAADYLGANLHPSSRIVASAVTLDDQGYWLVTAAGETYNFGDAQPVGNVPVKVAASIVGAAPAGVTGLWVASRDGGVFSLGAAPFMGSLGHTHLNAPIVGIASDISEAGYTLAAADGGVFTFGMGGFNANTPRFFGSLGRERLAAPIVAIACTLDGGGYVLAGADGGVFTFGNAGFFGSLGGERINAPIASIAVTADVPGLDNASPGYRLAGADGGVYTFNASFEGSEGGRPLAAPIIAIGGTSF